MIIPVVSTVCGLLTRQVSGTVGPAKMLDSQCDVIAVPFVGSPIGTLDNGEVTRTAFELVASLEGPISCPSERLSGPREPGK